MSFESLKQEVCEANLELVRNGLITLTWGNVSGIDREAGVVAIKPSGVPYPELSPDKIALLNLSDGKPLEGSLKPSSDTPTHLALYREYLELGGVVHTHSSMATAFAQAMMPVPCLGTTHADSFYGQIPVTRLLSDDEIKGEYELNTGRLIIETFKGLKEAGILDIPAVLVAQHGPFTWGATPGKAVENAIVLEEVAKMALAVFSLKPNAAPIPRTLLDKHFLRKHGSGAYYGQG